MNDIVSWLLSLGSQLGNWSYLILAAIIFLEALPLVGFFIPGVTALIIGGFLVSQGFIDFPTLLFFSSLGSFIGDGIAFFIGRRFTSSFRPDHPILKQKYLESAERFTERWGKSSLLIGRFLSVVRSMVNVVAGVAGMSWFSFLTRAALGSLLFCFVYLSIGYFAGSAWKTIASWSSRAAALLMVIVIVIACLWWLKGFVVRQGRQLKKILVSVLETAFQKIKKHLSPFVSQRLNPSSFFGLPILSLGILVLMLFLFILLLGFEAPVAGTLWANLDERIAGFFKLFINDHIAVFAFLITALCFNVFVAAFSALCTVWFFLEKRKSYIVGLLVGVIGTALSSYLIKFIVGRPRPEPLFYFENSYSFPSTHAAIALFLTLFLSYYAIRVYPRWSRNMSVVFAAVVITGLIAWSRLYLGVHYFSDVLAGLSLGGILLIIAIIIERRLAQYDNPRRLSKMWQSIVLAAFIIFLSGIFFSQTFNKIALQDLYHALPTNSVEQKSLTEILRNNVWPLRTENLRGGRERPIHFIFKSDTALLETTLIRNGWIKRDEPTIGTVLQRASAILFKSSYEAAPIRPRFWRNEPNIVSFTKVASGVKKEKDLYVLRLWRAPLFEKDNTPIYISELWIDRELSVPLSPRELVLDSARTQLLHDIEKNISHREELQVTIPLRSNKPEEGAENITVEIINLNTHE